jgi:3-dehydroquinate synthase
MSAITFQVQETTFQVSTDDLAASELTVRSVPRPYRVRQAAGGALDEIRRVLAASPKARLLADARVHALYLKPVDVAPSRLMLLRASEETKSLAGGVVPVIDWLAEAGMTKSDPLVVVGGGIVQDIAGFAALLFKRGLPWTFLPTTLLSQCDSCIGAKAGVNHGRHKNQLALFSAPREVVVDPAFLPTLEEEELRSGLGEVLKLHLTGGPFFVERFEAALDGAAGTLPSLAAIRALTWGSLVVKRAVIERDEFELDLRRALNYGHTIGHAIENLSGFAIPHGKAICLGMAIVNQVAVNRGILPVRDHEAVLRLVDRVVDDGAREALGRLDMGQLRDALSRDKKNTGSTLNLVVMAEVGRLAFLGVENDERFAGELREIVQSLTTARGTDRGQGRTT